MIVKNEFKMYMKSTRSSRKSINVAKKNLKKFNNISYFQETTDSCTLENNSQDFGYCLGVLGSV